VNIIRIGVIGVGHLGALHAKMLADIPQVRLAGVYDLNPKRAESVAADHHTFAVASLPELLQGVDAVTIARARARTLRPPARHSKQASMSSWRSRLPRQPPKRSNSAVWQT